MNKKPLLIGFGLIIALILWSVISLYPDWLWFDNLGFSPVFMKMLLSRYGFGVLVWVLLITLISVNFSIAKRLHPGSTSGMYLKEKGNYASQFGMSEKTLNLMVIAFIFILSIVVASKSSKHWDLILRYLYQQPFGTVDPVFGRDVSYYMFSLPFQLLVKNGLVFLIGVSTLITAGWYFKYGVIQIEGDMAPLDGSAPAAPSVKIAPNAKRHLIFLCGVIAVFFAWGYYLKVYELLFSNQGPAFGASYTDVNIKVLTFRISLVLCLLFASFLFYNAFKPNMKILIKSGIGCIGAIVILTFIIPVMAQKFIVKPNELAKEAEYIKHNIEFTRQAYDLNTMKEVPFNVSDNLTSDIIAENDATIQNIRIWDERPLLQTYRQLEAIRLYYDFHNVDVDRYQINGKYRQIMLSARELVANQLPPQANTWVNRHLKYTHGYGLVSSPVNEVTDEGLPHLILKDIPPVSDADMQVDRPEIYFGERTEDYILIKTKEEEFDYGKGDANVFTIYQGEGGVPISSFMRKLLFAVEFMDPQILFTTSLTPESRIMYNRRIRNRLNILAPFLQYDSDPYIVVSGGKLYWIMDAYTTSDMYPYSVRSQMPGTKKYINYIRNSVKVVIDAYNGKVDFYAMDDKDPILKTYEAIFPGLLKPFETMSDDLKKHVRYPKDLFKIQVGTYTKYHMTDVQVFYNQEDLWQKPDEVYGDARLEMEPYYIIIKLPEEDKEEFLLMLPFTPYKKDNMFGWLAARCDQPDYGNLFVYKLPKGKLVYGPMQIEARIDQQTEISRELSLWDQRGSRVIRGNLLAIPVGDTFIYAEPVYLEAKQESSAKTSAAPAQKGFFPKPPAGGQGGAGRGSKASSSLPELKRVIIAHGNQLVMHEKLDDALRAILGTDVLPEQPVTEKTLIPVITSESDLSDMAQKALSHYRKGKEYLRKGDWSGYGKEQKELEKMLEIMTKEK